MKGGDNKWTGQDGSMIGSASTVTISPTSKRAEIMRNLEKMEKQGIVASLDAPLLLIELEGLTK